MLFRSIMMDFLTSVPADPCSVSSTGRAEVEDYAVEISSVVAVNPNLTYTWNPGTVNGSTVTLTPSASANYTVTATNTAGCSGTSAPLSVTVIPVPVAPLVTNSTQCGTAIPAVSATTQSGTVNPIFYWWNSATPAS